MASLAVHQEALKNRTKKRQISKAIAHEKRLKFHTESFMSAYEISEPATVFLNWVEHLLPKDKYNMFVSLFQFPVPTIELTNKIYEQLERVFDGKNPAENYRFTSLELKEDWEEYRKEKLNQPTVWRTEGWGTMKTAINSVLVIDLPAEQTTPLPEPYFYWLDISKVIDYEMQKDKISSILFYQDEKVVILDTEFYRVVEIDSKNEINEVVIETPHDLGYCPAQFFWTDNLVYSEKDQKKNPMSSELANLDWLLFYSISKKHLDLYAPYPIYSGYESDCSFENMANGDFCDGGFLRGEDQNYKILRDGTVEKCPVCAEKNLAGVGSFVEVPAPKSKEDPDLRNPITITTVDRNSLDYNVEEQERLSKKIEDSVVGSGSTAQESQALNRDHISANYTLKTNILNNLKVNFENAIRFVNDTVCRLRYQNEFLGSYNNLGTEFYIYSTSDLYLQFEQAKKNGANESELDAISDEIISTQYRNDPQTMQRMLILRHLEPYRHLTRDELLNLRKEGLVDDDLMAVKINFNNFIDKFERENINLLEFGSLLSFDKKISIIQETLKNYVQQTKNIERVSI